MLQKPTTNDVKSRRAFFAAMRTLALVVVMLVAGCSRFGDDMLQFNPTSFPDCKGPNIVVQVTWDATGKTKQNVTIQVYKPGNSPTVWYVGAPKGHHDTGEWMADGSTMRLIDSNNKLLAMRTLETTPCE
ncbi:MAG: hypothetical protein ABI247_11300 [Rhodanobacter sp.]